MHDILVIHTKPRRCLEFLTVGAVSFDSQFFSIKTMGTNAMGSGSATRLTGL